MREPSYSGALALCALAVGCSSGNDGGKTASQLEVELTMGGETDRISDSEPVVRIVGDQFDVMSRAKTASGSQLVIQVSRANVSSVGTYDVGLATEVKVGFTTPGSTGAIFFETGSLSLIALDWSQPGGRLEGTLEGLHRPADSLGLAPETSATGTAVLLVPAQ